MRASRMFAAVIAAVVAAFLSLGGASLVIAQPGNGNGQGNQVDNGNGQGNGQGNGHSDQAAPDPSPAPQPEAVPQARSHGSGQSRHDGGGTQAESPAPQHGNGNGNAERHAAQPQVSQPAPAPSTTTGGGSHSTASSGPGNSAQGCDGSHNSDTGHGANHSGPYDNTCNGTASGNGNGNGKAVGKPCAGCVGNADDKNPKGQYPNGSDHNAGYECDRNHGIGRTNPAHTGCRTTETTTSGSTGCSGDMSGGNDSGKCGNGGSAGEQQNAGCAQLGSALTSAAAVVLKAVALAHPEVARLADLAANVANNGCHEDNGNGHQPITICHATGSATNPYVEITIDENGLNGHGGHPDDIIPAPATGCPVGNVITPPVVPPSNEQNGSTPPGTPVVPPTNTVLGTNESGQAPATTPATTPTPGQQAVLGIRESGGKAPAKSSPSGNKVLGAQAQGGKAPAAAVAPAAAQRALPAAEARGTLPFTGTDALLVLFLGCLMTLTGVTVHRLVARRSN